MEHPLTCTRLHEPVQEVRHANLKRFGDSVFKSVCPACREGLLLVRRDEETFDILAEDTCILCCQRFKYLDIKELRRGGFVSLEDLGKGKPREDFQNDRRPTGEKP